MLIRNSTELFTAMLEGKSFTLDSEGEIQTKKQRGLFKKQSPRVSPELTAKQNNSLLISMAKLIEYEARSSVGRQNLQYPLPIGGKTFEETMEKSRLTLGCKMIEFVAQKELKDQPKAIVQGTIPYLQALWQHEHPDGPADIHQIQSIVTGMLNELKSDPGNSLAQLAYGYSLGPTELQEHMAYLEEDIVKGVQCTWDEAHQYQFDENGVYDIFCRDVTRDRPYFQSVKLSPEEYDNNTAEKKYKEMLIEAFPERSMAAVVGICMSQTIMSKFSGMLMNVGTPFPLNPYTEKNADSPPRIITIVTSNKDPLPKEPLQEEVDEDLKVRQTPPMGAKGGILFKESSPKEFKGIIGVGGSSDTDSVEEAEEGSDQEASTSTPTVKPLSLRERLIKTAQQRTTRTMLFNNPDSILIVRNLGITLKDTETGLFQQVGSVSFMLQIPKEQFPLSIGTRPIIKVVDMQVERSTPFVGHHAIEKGFIGQILG